MSKATKLSEALWAASGLNDGTGRVTTGELVDLAEDAERLERANADMLEALRDLLTWIDDRCQPGDRWAALRARAAIAKATDDRCPRCQKPGHATETDEDGYHPGCRPMTAAEVAEAIEAAHALGRDLLLDLGDKLRGVAEWLNCCEGKGREFDYVADLATRLLHAGEVRS